MKRILFYILFFFIIKLTYAQSSVDALRYSFISNGGNARYMSMGGAFGALGANTSTFSTNPAGIGLFNASDFNVSSSIIYSTTESVYNENFGSDSRLNAGLANVGVVLTKDYLNIEPHGKWKNVQFGFGINQLKSFNNRIYISGPNTAHSIADFYAELANGISVDDIENDYYGDYSYDLNPAWWSFLINNIDNSDQYFGTSPPGGVFQGKLIETWGSLNEITVTFGANYDNRLYIGATLGVPYFNYHESSIYTEDALQENIPDSTYRSVVIRDRLNTNGTGFNLKLGAIYKLSDWFRFGMAIHTPTFYTQMQDEWDVSITSTWDTYDDEKNNSPRGFYEYELTTPFRAIASVAFIIQNYGLISAEYELVDYAAAKLNSPDYKFQVENDEIRSTYTSTNNIRLGTEWRVQNLSFRGGYNYYGSPFKNNINNGSTSSYSLGLGYKDRNFYFDLAWILTKQSEDYYLYGYGNVNANKTVNNFKHSNILMTYGFRF
ncbi:MAG: hypothetical protein GY834_13820 [Bacteroidetes bacterium]|nr:hypothetical protein [Bacteroidota bacterium]